MSSEKGVQKSAIYSKDYIACCLAELDRPNTINEDHQCSMSICRSSSHEEVDPDVLHPFQIGDGWWPSYNRQQLRVSNHAHFGCLKFD